MALREQTQSNTDPGNCWQTAVACILQVPAESLPSQVVIEAAPNGSFHNHLNAYLDVHHGLMYSELYEYQFGALDVREPGHHVLIGPSVRTPASGFKHAVVARHGEMVWDPHPSREGLTGVERWGILAPLPAWLRKERAEKRANGNGTACLCPACASG